MWRGKGLPSESTTADSFLGSFKPICHASSACEKEDGKLRLCVNYHALNTYKDAYPLPRVNEALDVLKGPCMPGDMSCDEENTLCIKQYMWCNGEVDCPNAVDELHCQQGNCLSNQFKCKNGKCLPLSLNCNYRDDCGDNSDELDEGACQIRSCVIGEFMCASHECIPIYQLCDDKPDCADGTDEMFMCEKYKAGFCYYDVRVQNWGCTGPPLIRMACDGGLISSCQYGSNQDECIHPTDKCNGAVDCFDGFDELNCETHYWKCPYGQFKCGTGHCILHELKCNGIMDCKDGSDEMECGDNTLAGLFSFENMWTCNDGSMEIPSQLRCNGYLNCVDESDELDCKKYQCPKTMVKCAETHFCIDQSKTCDGSYDCTSNDMGQDLTDEKSCEESVCPPDRFRCGNGQCIDMKHRCDYHYHCLDRSDEMNCTLDDCAPNEKLCSINKEDYYCMDDTQWCDVHVDCYHKEDDECDAYTCPSHMIVCGLRCAGIEERCDLSANCAGGNDEVDCENHMCPDDSYFRCRNGQCIPWYLYCDEPIRPDCADGSDELFCNNICADSEFQCVSGWCINATYTCDGVNDCGDNSDEDNCPQYCGEDEYECNGLIDGGVRITSKCIKWDRRCDRFVNCYQGDDEADCQYKVHDVTAEENWYDQYIDLSGDKTLYEEFRQDVFVNRPIDFIPREHPPLWEHFLVSSNTPDFSDLKHVLHLNQGEIRELGHQGEDLILQCTYDQRECGISDFHQFQDDVYGNCYTFNHGLDQNALKTASNTGSEFGLKLTLFTEQSEYISIFGQESGVRFMVHDPFTPPFLEDEGIDAKTGTATSVILKQREEKRTSPPWGNCTDDEYVDSGEYRYSLIACQKDCLHSRMYEYCGCVDTFYQNKRQCDVFNKTQDVCAQLMYFFYQKGKLGCMCQQPCSVTQYQKMLSLTSWPSSTFSPRLLSSLMAVNPKIRTLSGYDVSMNLARIKIYFESLNFERVLEVEDYPYTQLMADIGGALGLWVGLSIITVVEFAEFIYEIILSLIKKRSKREDVSNDVTGLSECVSL
ncbi:uncharacterized protein LOC144349047 [Saccoglossus kowalevskii]